MSIVLHFYIRIHTVYACFFYVMEHIFHGYFAYQSLHLDYMAQNYHLSQNTVYVGIK